jgi:antitoxin VapB
MTIYLKDEATSKAVRKLAKLRGTTLTEAVRNAVNKELAVNAEDAETIALRKLQERFASRSATGKKADKDFYDSLYED